MNDHTKAEWKHKTLKWISRIKKMVELDAPSLIIANEVCALYWLTVGFLGEFMTQQMGQHALRYGRMYVGCCQMCGELLPWKRKENICEECSAKVTGEVFGMELEYPDEDEES